MTTTESSLTVHATLSLHVPDSAILVRPLLPPPQITVVGRSTESSIAVPHSSVSRQHARLSFNNGVWLIEDLGSTNGIRVGGHPVRTHELKHGEWFSLGDVFCEFRTHLAPPDARSLLRHSQRQQASGIWLSRIEQATDRNSLLANLLAAVVQLAECRRGFLLVNSNGSYSTAACYGIQSKLSANKEFSGSSAVIARAMHENKAVLINDPSVLDWAKGRPSIVRDNLRAMVALPICYADTALGVVYADSDETGKVFSELDQALLQAFAQQAALILAARGLDAELARFEACIAVDSEGSPSGSIDAPPMVSLP